MDEFSIFSHTRLNERSYVITESYGFNPDIPNSYMHLGLVVGDDKVAVIDSGTAGTSGLRRYIEEVILEGRNTKPVICLLTHNHVDHISGCMMFDERYLHEADINEEDLWWNTHEERRLLSDDSDLCAFANYDKEVIDYCREHYYKVKPTVNDFIPLKDGDVIDLGGIELAVTHLPAHSKGSVAYYDAKNHIAYCGDSLSMGGLPPEKLYELTCRCLERFAPDSMLIDGHAEAVRRMEPLRNQAKACEDVLNGVNLENDKPVTGNFRPFFKFTKERAGLKDTRPAPDPNMIRMAHLYKDARVMYSVPKKDE